MVGIIAEARLYGQIFHIVAEGKHLHHAKDSNRKSNEELYNMEGVWVLHHNCKECPHLLIAAQSNNTIYIWLEPIGGEYIYVLDILKYLSHVHPLCNVCIVVDIGSVFEHQEGMTLKLH